MQSGPRIHGVERNVMMNKDIPTITGSSYSTTMYDSVGPNDVIVRAGQNADFAVTRRLVAGVAGGDFFKHGMPFPQAGFIKPMQPLEDEYQDFSTGEQEMATRVVRVFIFDPNESLALESRLLFKSNEKLTDLTDQELFFELPMADMLTKHNELRAKTVDKTQTAKLGKEMYLETVRIRDLKMVVVTIAQF